MKYMGSKRIMLRNGLGDLIERQGYSANRVIDPFCGSGAVAWHAAEKTGKPVIATDLQEYAVIMARAVLQRTTALDAELLAEEWFKRANDTVTSWPQYQEAHHHTLEDWNADPKGCVDQARALCMQFADYGPVWAAYGGHYFSPLQALTLDALRSTLPNEEPHRSAALAALISAASACTASPGHTAQPFQPTIGAAEYLLEAWRRDPFYYCRRELEEICSRRSQVVGTAYVQDAQALASQTQEGDLVILDPPYSNVHYSRFYHVLETVARGKCETVEGVGRYPPRHERPQSLFSLQTKSRDALANLLASLSENKATAILTFPVGQSSNGLSGNAVIEIAQEYFRVAKESVNSRFSTLGGNKDHRPARHNTHELILLLIPKT